MKKIVTFAAVAAGALALSACGGKTEEAPAAEPTAETEAMAPAEETPAAEATDSLDPTGNPIPPAAAAGAEAAPAAE
jgi:hypothetical protein